MRDLPRWARLVAAAVIFAVVVLVLFTTVFPRIEAALINDPVLQR